MWLLGASSVWDAQFVCAKVARSLVDPTLSSIMMWSCSWTGRSRSYPIRPNRKQQPGHPGLTALVCGARGRSVSRGAGRGAVTRYPGGEGGHRRRGRPSSRRCGDVARPRPRRRRCGTPRGASQNASLAWSMRSRETFTVIFWVPAADFATVAGFVTVAGVSAVGNCLSDAASLDYSRGDRYGSGHPSIDLRVVR
jgi:hypothetical protein